MKKIVLMGATASIGKKLLRVLKKDYSIITAGRRDCDIVVDLADVNKNIIFPEADILINVAAMTRVAQDADLPIIEETNSIGSLRLSIAAYNANIKRFINVSSIYASLNETSSQYSMYAISKKHGDDLVAYYCRQRSIDYTILRPSPIYGNTDEFRVNQPFFYFIVDKAEKGSGIEIFGKHDALRNFMHVDDLCEIIRRVIIQNVNGLYSVTYPTNERLSTIAAAAYEAFGQTNRTRFLPDKPDIPDIIFPYDDTLYQTIAFVPKISIRNGMEKIALHRLEN